MKKSNLNYILKPEEGKAERRTGKEEVLLVKEEIKKKFSKQESVEIQTKTRWTVRELLTTQLPKQRWAVPGLIPIGLTFLSGLPKAGKSWLALQIACAVGTGGEVFGIKVTKRKVLYLALEDGPHRLQDRLRSRDTLEDTNIIFETQWALLEETGQYDLEIAIKDEKYSFVVIDTMSRFCGKDQLKSDEMSKYLGPLQKLALTNNLSILVIDHNSKGRRGSSILKIYGSIAKPGVADMIYTLDREDNDMKAILRGLGRDVGTIGAETIINLKWSQEGCLWQNVEAPLPSTEPKTFKDKVKKTICELVEEGRPATTTTIALKLGVKPPTVSVVLSDLFNDGKVLKLEKIGKEVPYVLIQ